MSISKINSNSLNTDEATLSFSTSGTERMRIDSSGNVGINRSSPNGLLHMQSPSGTDSALYIQTNAATDDSVINFGDDSSSTVGKILYGHSDNSMRFNTLNSERMRIDSSGNLLVGTTNARPDENYDVGTAFHPTGKRYSYSTTDFGVYNTNSTGKKFYFRINNSEKGSISFNTNSVSYTTTSDYRLKENAVDITDGITRVKQLDPKRFNFIGDSTIVDGFLAHEAQEVVPEAVQGEKDAMREEEYEVTPAVIDEDGNVVTEAVMGTRQVPDYQGIDQSKLVPLLTAALKEAIAKIETLEARVAALENA